MIDPLTAAALATKAYTGVRAFIEAGKSIEDTFHVVARWQGHVSDVVYATEKKKKVNPFKRVMFSGSVEAEAAELFAARKKVETQKKELISMLNLAYGKEGVLQYRECIKEVAEQRRRDVYEAQEAKEFIGKMGILIVMLGLGAFIFYLIIDLATK